MLDRDLQIVSERHTHRLAMNVMTSQETEMFLAWAKGMGSYRPSELGPRSVTSVLEVLSFYKFASGLIEHALESCNIHEVVPDTWLTDSNRILPEYRHGIKVVIYIVMSMTELFNENGEMTFEAIDLIGDLTHRMEG